MVSLLLFADHKDRPAETCRWPTAKTGPKERAVPRRSFAKAGEGLSGKAFHPRSN